jgi:hypothetical protein
MPAPAAVSRVWSCQLFPGPGGGLSVFGDRKIEVSPGDGPEIRVDGYSLFGDVTISDRSSV